MHQNINGGTACVHIVNCASKTMVKSNCFLRVKTGPNSPNCYFEHFVKKDSEEDIEYFYLESLKVLKFKDLQIMDRTKPQTNFK